MGKYSGETPLTVLGERTLMLVMLNRSCNYAEKPSPSGFDYRPSTSLTTRKPPEYSITGKPYPKKCMLLAVLHYALEI